MIHSTATPGIMARPFRDRWDNPDAEVCVHAFVDDGGVVQLLPWKHRAWHCGVGTSGKSANNTHIALELCEPEPLWLIYRRTRREGSRGYDVTRLQLELARLGLYSGAPDGSFGPLTAAAVDAFRRGRGLAAGAVCDGPVWDALNADPASLTRFSPALTADYFRAVYGNAVSLCAALCREYALGAGDILSHAEGFALGVASNHGDVGHWFPLQGVTMDDFRRAVRERLAARDFAAEVQGRFGLADGTVDYLRAYEYGEALLEKLATAK